MHVRTLDRNFFFLYFFRNICTLFLRTKKIYAHASSKMCTYTIRKKPLPLVHFSYTFGKPPPSPLACVRLLWMPPNIEWMFAILILLSSNITYHISAYFIRKIEKFWNDKKFWKLAHGHLKKSFDNPDINNTVQIQLKIIQIHQCCCQVFWQKWTNRISIFL